MSMRDYNELKNIIKSQISIVEIAPEQEGIMNIIRDAWDECQNSDCKTCIDRPEKCMRIMECTALKYTRKIIEAGYKKQQHGHWAHLGGDEWCCSVCGNVIFTEGSWIKPTQKYCDNCGAEMDGDAK